MTTALGFQYSFRFLKASPESGFAVAKILQAFEIFAVIRLNNAAVKCCLSAMALQDSKIFS